MSAPRRRNEDEDTVLIQKTLQETVNKLNVRVVGVRFQGQRRTRLTALSKAFEEPIREATNFEQLHEKLLKIRPLLKQNFNGATNIEIEVDERFAIDGDTLPFTVKLKLPEEKNADYFVGMNTNTKLSDATLNVQVSRPNVFGNFESLSGSLELKQGQKTSPVSFQLEFNKPLEFHPSSQDFYLRVSSQSEDSHSYGLQSHVLKTGIKNQSNLTGRLHNFEYILASRTMTPTQQANMEVRESGNFSTKSSVSYTVSRDTRDHPALPSRGYFGQIAQEVAGLFGDARFYRFEFTGHYNTPITNQAVLTASLSSSFVTPLGSNLRVFDKCFFKPGTLKCFDTTLHNSGGTDYAVTGTLQLTKALERFGHGRIFLNTGVAANVDKDATIAQNIQSFKHGIRASLGFGLILPIGIQLSWGYPILRQDKDLYSWFGVSFASNI